MARSKKRREKVSARERAETHKSEFESTAIERPEGMDFFSLDSDKPRRIDIIPYVAGEGNPHREQGKVYFERTYYSHREIGPNSDKFVCPAKTANKPCPICEYRNELLKSGDKDADTKKQIKALAPKQRQLFFVVDADDRESGVQLWDMSFHMFGKLLDYEVRNADEDEDFEFFPDPEDGYTLKLGVAEKSIDGGRPFYEVISITFKTRSEGYPDDVAETVPCLDDLIKIVPYDKLREIFLQIEDEDEDGDKRSSGKSSKRERPNRRKVEKADPDEDDTNEAEEKGIAVGDVVEHDEFGAVTIIRINSRGDKAVVEDSGEEEHRVEVEDLEKPKPKPKSKPKSKPKPKPDEDDDEDSDTPKKPRRKPKPKPDEDDEDDDEDPTPPKKSSRKSKGKKEKPSEEDSDDSSDDDDWSDWD